MDVKIISLRMERQCFIHKANELEYIKLYRDTQPGQNVYWNGFGQPPTLSFRADDAESRKDEIIEAIRAVNYGKSPKRFIGKEL